MGNWKGLQRMIRAHGDLIHRRWVKKKPTQRETLFREIYPDMPTEHRPDCQFYFKELLLTGTMTPGAPRTRMKDFRATCRGAWLWPYLNLDIKGTPREFLLLLDSRVYHHPAQFSVSDLRACDVGSLLDVFSWYYIGGDIVMTDPAVADSYGETRPHNAKRTSVMEFSMEEVSAFKSTREEFQTRAFGQPTTTGVLLLQIQEQLYGFLWTCCRAILHDIQYDELLSMPQEIKSHALLEFGCTQNTSAMVMARESPYQPAMEVNYKRIVALLAGRLDASHDHLQALREDPAYFLEQQRIWKEIQSRTRESMMPEEPPIEFTDSWASIQVTHHALGKVSKHPEIIKYYFLILGVFEFQTLPPNMKTPCSSGVIS